MSVSTADAPVRKSVLVDATPEEAFRVFTKEAAGWWPIASHSLLDGEATSLVFEEAAGGRVYERAPDGREADWGRVLAWEPPHRFVMTWEISDPPTELEVRFLAEPPGTRVELEHRGWGGDDERRNSYDGGWEFVLGRFAELMQPA
jgi:uncharacterized protein YndB with AHSA1/START domain